MNLRRRRLIGSNRGTGFKVGGAGLRADSGSSGEAVYPGIQFTLAPGLGGQTGRPRKKTYRRSANDRFKEASQSRLALGLIVAVTAHVGLFEAFPRMHAAALPTAEALLVAIELPPEVQIPPPPEQIVRPATPKVAAVEVAEDITIAPTTFESNPVKNLPPPPKTKAPESRPSFIPYTVGPKLKNATEVLAVLERVYPTRLREARIGGTVLLWLYIDASGRVQRTVLGESSGSEALDEAAQEVVAKMLFSPAMNRDHKTDVWIAQAVSFKPPA